MFRPHFDRPSVGAQPRRGAARAAPATPAIPPASGLVPAVATSVPRPFRSQYGQDEFLETTVFHGLRGGVYVDVGAHDGLTLNNTYFFQQERGWSGLNIEPIPAVFAKLCTHRPDDTNLNVAIADRDGTAEFIVNTGYTEMLSGLRDSYHPRHHTRLRNELAARGGTSVVITVPTRTLTSVCDERGVTHIHYLTIDVEGGEEAVIRSLDFQRVYVDVVQFEDNYNNAQTTVSYLVSQGYRVLKSDRDIFMIRCDSPFASPDSKT